MTLTEASKKYEAYMEALFKGQPEQRMTALKIQMGMQMVGLGPSTPDLPNILRQLAAGEDMFQAMKDEVGGSFEPDPDEEDDDDRDFDPPDDDDIRQWEGEGGLCSRCFHTSRHQLSDLIDPEGRPVGTREGRQTAQFMDAKFKELMEQFTDPTYRHTVNQIVHWLMLITLNAGIANSKNLRDAQDVMVKLWDYQTELDQSFKQATDTVQ